MKSEYLKMSAVSVMILSSGASTSVLVFDVPLGWSDHNAQREWSFKRSGSQMRFEVRSGDVWVNDKRRLHVAERSEISQLIRWPQGDAVWFSFALMVEPGPKSTAKWVELGQLHRSRGIGEISASPAVSQGLGKGDFFRISLRFSKERPLRHNVKPDLLFVDHDFQRGCWYHFVYRVRYTPTAEGLLQVWRNGDKVVDYRGPVGYFDPIGPYLKFGIYRYPAPETLAARYANFEISYNGSLPTSPEFRNGMCNVGGEAPAKMMNADRG